VKEFLKKEWTAAINRSCALYGQAGITGAAQKDLKDAEGRAARHGDLPEELRGYACLLEDRFKVIETRLEGM
jgi:hypothetical protein